MAAIVRPRRQPTKLPTGQMVASTNPIAEFAKNVGSRRKALLDELEEKGNLTATKVDQIHRLVDRWEADAMARRRGLLAPEDRAAALRLTLAQLEIHDAAVTKLERGAWKKAADFYRGLCQSGIFDQTILVYGGVYSAPEQRTLGWDEVRQRFGVSRETVLRRVRGGASVPEALAPARPQASIEHDGEVLSVDAFAARFGLPVWHVRSCRKAGMVAAEILRTPPRGRGRPKAGEMQTGDA